MLSNAIIRPAAASDAAAISKLHDKAFGPGRFSRAAYRVREDTGDTSRFCRVAYNGSRLLAALRMTEISIGNVDGALLLGPLAVDPEHVGEGLGTRLVAECLEAARAAGLHLVILVGDASYYGRFGFKPVQAGQILFPGPVDMRRVLAVELAPGALMRYRGLIRAKV